MNYFYRVYPANFKNKCVDYAIFAVFPLKNKNKRNTVKSCYRDRFAISTSQAETRLVKLHRTTSLEKVRVCALTGCKQLLVYHHGFYCETSTG